MNEHSIVPDIIQWKRRRGQKAADLIKPLIEDSKRWEAVTLAGGPAVRLRDRHEVSCVFKTRISRDNFLRTVRRRRAS